MKSQYGRVMGSRAKPCAVVMMSMNVNDQRRIKLGLGVVGSVAYDLNHYEPR
jgi:hypothetical protein